MPAIAFPRTPASLLALPPPARAVAGCGSARAMQPRRLAGSITPYRSRSCRAIRDQGAGRGAQARHEPPAGARHPRLAAADQRVPRRPLGLRLHASSARASSRSSAGCACSSRATRWSASRATPMPSEAEFVASLDNQRKDAARSRCSSQRGAAASSSPPSRAGRRAPRSRRPPAAARRQLPAARSAGPLTRRRRHVTDQRTIPAPGRRRRRLAAAWATC